MSEDDEDLDFIRDSGPTQAVGQTVGSTGPLNDTTDNLITFKKPLSRSHSNTSHDIEIAMTESSRPTV